MSENPWHLRLDSAPYVLELDSPLVLEHNRKVGTCSSLFLHIDQILPEPFVGAKDAPVVLLSNNPGFGKKAVWKEINGFMDRMRKNLVHEDSRYPFLYLDPDFSEVGWWWERKLKHLLNEFDREVLARSVLNIAYFPYPSRRFGHRHLPLPSQAYSFGLVRDAVKAGAVIVFMRRDAMWKEAVAELKTYDRVFKVNNVQNPAISPANLPEDGYQSVVRAIAAAGRR